MIYAYDEFDNVEYFKEAYKFLTPDHSNFAIFNVGVAGNLGLEIYTLTPFNPDTLATVATWSYAEAYVHASHYNPTLKYLFTLREDSWAVYSSTGELSYESSGVPNTPQKPSGVFPRRAY